MAAPAQFAPKDRERQACALVLGNEPFGGCEFEGNTGQMI